ncbi:GNAT family N-acetyltransferase [Paenibacillus sp. GCM10012306]|uniref:GNAT family N-acetyltransferase n=1 Tax=Paenibacillus sp. GCM10012306 TaxID=3317342 RepID=UPI0036204680
MGITMPKYRLELADKEKFAVYQVIYADTDIEMWYDWNTRLQDTQFSDQCYWVLRDDVRIGGAIINDGTVMYPFLIPPFADRTVFWRALFSCSDDIKHINGLLQQDVSILLTFGYKLGAVRQVMCCPADDSITAVLPDGFSVRSLDESTDIATIAKILMEGYAGGIDYETYGAPDEAKAIADVQHLMKVYEHRNLSVYVFDEQEQGIAGLCIAGIYEKMPLGFAEVGDLCVLPKYRNNRLAEAMLNNVRSTAYAHSQVVKLCVTVGNEAEHLYRKVGFYPGPQFANMSRQ